MFTFINGQIVKEEEATILATDLSYQFGYGLFETIKCDGGIPLFFEDHYKRLFKSSKELKMEFPVSEEELSNWVIDLLKANKLQKARVKLIISKRLEGKFNVSIFAAQLETIPESCKLIAKKTIRDLESLSSRHKSTSRLDYHLDYMEAVENRFNDALYINEKNELLECTRSNIFLIMEDRIITPKVESNILDGVMRNIILRIAEKENIVIEEKNVHSLYLNRAKGFFVANAIIGIMPVSDLRVEDKEYNFSIHPEVISLKNSLDAEIQEYVRKSALVKAFG